MPRCGAGLLIYQISKAKSEMQADEKQQMLGNCVSDIITKCSAGLPNHQSKQQLFVGEKQQMLGSCVSDIITKSGARLLRLRHDYQVRCRVGHLPNQQSKE